MLKVGFIIPLIIMNVLLLIIVIDFWKNCRSKAAKVGFGIMLTVYVLDILSLIGSSAAVSACPCSSCGTASSIEIASLYDNQFFIRKIPEGGEIFPPNIACSRNAPIKAFADCINSCRYELQSSPLFHRKSVVLLICNAIQRDSTPGLMLDLWQRSK